MKFLLESPMFFEFFNLLIGVKKYRKIICKDYIKPFENCNILDIGCGTGDFLNYFEDVHYTGFDGNNSYIEFAKKRFKNKGNFIHGYLSENLIKEPNTFDIVIAIGILHHLSDDEVIDLFKTAKNCLRPDGRLITVDGCYTGNQSKITKYILRNDRGKFVRDLESYVNLAKKSFKEVEFEIRKDLLNIPYTHIIMQLKN